MPGCFTPMRSLIWKLTFIGTAPGVTLPLILDRRYILRNRPPAHTSLGASDGAKKEITQKKRAHKVPVNLKADASSAEALLLSPLLNRGRFRAAPIAFYGRGLRTLGEST